MGQPRQLELLAFVVMGIAVSYIVSARQREHTVNPLFKHADIIEDNSCQKSHESRSIIFLQYSIQEVTKGIEFSAISVPSALRQATQIYLNGSKNPKLDKAQL